MVKVLHYHTQILLDAWCVDFGRSITLPLKAIQTLQIITHLPKESW